MRDEKVFHVTRCVRAIVSVDVVAEDFADALKIAETFPVFGKAWKVEDEALNEPCGVARDDLWDEVMG